MLMLKLKHLPKCHSGKVFLILYKPLIMTTITSSGFFTQVLGEVSHPINIVREYLEAFGNKCKAAIITWLDSWTRTKIAQGKDTWVWERQRNLAKELGYNKETINIHLNKLIDDGIIEVALQTPNSCSRLLKYRLNIDNLAIFLGQKGFSPLNRNSVHGKTDSRTTEDGNPDSNLIHSLNSNNPKSNELINNSDDVEADTLSNLEELREEKPVIDPPVDKPKLKSQLEQITPHEDQSSAAPQRDVTSPDAEINNQLVASLGVTLNPKLKRFLASVTVEEVLKGLAAYYYATEVKEAAIASKTGFIIDSIKNNYFENENMWINANERDRLYFLLSAGAIAMGVDLVGGWTGAIYRGEMLFNGKDGEGKVLNFNLVAELLSRVGLAKTLEAMLENYRLSI